MANLFEVKSLFEEKGKDFCYPAVQDDIHVPYGRQDISCDKLDALLSDHRSSNGWQFDAIISYVSDIHLENRLQQLKAKTEEDVCRYINGVVETLNNVAGEIVIIAGDVCHTYKLFEMFVNRLYEVNSHHSWLHKHYVFVLGNHELWSMPSFCEAVSKYRELLESKDMYLLQNNLLSFEESEHTHRGGIHFIGRIIDNFSDVKTETKNSCILMFGGIGFLGFNRSFNADNGVYDSTICRNEEITQSVQFNEIYESLLPVLKSHNSVVVTHMPKSDWSNSDIYEPGIVYVSGHTHRNMFYDDGNTRLYADNQVGYKSTWFSMKAFWLCRRYDPFVDYTDGIYRINFHDYKMFLQGHGRVTDGTKEPIDLTMLKHNGYYMFTCLTKSGALAILNGGSAKTLPKYDIHWFYDNMDNAVATILKRLPEYTVIQTKIADYVKSWGGTGTIHGCIIDIDFVNHIYLNPYDGKLTYYHATDIVNKTVYPSIPALLSASSNKMLLQQYQKRLGSNDDKLLPVVSTVDAPREYLDTDIYKVSRYVYQTQKIFSNIIVFWPDHFSDTSLALSDNISRYIDEGQLCD